MILLNAKPLLIPRKMAPAIWFAALLAPRTINEGESATMTLRIQNYKPGARAIWWMTGGAAATSRWLRSWSSIFIEVCQANGLTCTVLRTTGTPPLANGTTDMLITIPEGSSYAGQTLVFTNKTRLNRRDDKNPTTAQTVLLSKYTDRVSGLPTDPDILKVVSGGNAISILDTSKRPTGTPTFSMNAYDVDGVSPPKTVLFPGDGVMIELKALNVIPATEIKLYAAGEAQNMLTPSFRNALLAAIKAYGPAVSYKETKWRPVMPPGEFYYNGYTLVFNEGYDETRHIRFILYAGQKMNVGTNQLDLISLITKEGSAADLPSYQPKGDWASDVKYARGDWITYIPTGVKYIALDSVPLGTAPEADSDYWREYVPVQVLSGGKSYALKQRPPRFFEIRAVKNGSNIDYNINVPYPEFDRIVNVGNWLEDGAYTRGDLVHHSDGFDYIARRDMAAPKEATETSPAIVLRELTIPYYWFKVVEVKTELSWVNAPAGFEAALVAACAVPECPVSFNNGVIKPTEFTDKIKHDVSFSVPLSGAGKHTLELNNTTGSWATIAYGCVYLTDPGKPVDPYFTVGVNLSTGEFGSNPGTYFNSYIYPSRPEQPEPRKHEYMNYLWSLGIRFIRFPIKWERIQREPYADLYGEKDSSAPWVGSLDIARCDELMDYWTNELGGRVGLDIHNFGGYKSKEPVYDYEMDPAGKQRDVEEFFDLWIKLGNRYAHNEKIWFFLMNEPNGGKSWSPQRCRVTFQSLVNVIRSKTSARNKILVPAADYSSTANFVSSGQAEEYETLYDPVNNCAIELHNYFNSTKSGAGADAGVCMANSQNQFNSAISWAQEHIPIFIGEVAGGDPTKPGQSACGQVVPAAYAKLTAAKGAVLGWSSWGFGPFWGPDYAFNMNPLDYQTPSPPVPNMAALIPFIREDF